MFSYDPVWLKDRSEEERLHLRPWCCFIMRLNDVTSPDPDDHYSSSSLFMLMKDKVQPIRCEYQQREAVRSEFISRRCERGVSEFYSGLSYLCLLMWFYVCRSESQVVNFTMSVAAVWTSEGVYKMNCTHGWFNMYTCRERHDSMF